MFLELQILPIKFCKGAHASIHTFRNCKYNDLDSVSLYFLGLIGNVPVLLAKPQTFMNLSGESVSKLVLKDLLIIIFLMCVYVYAFTILEIIE